MGKGGTTYPAAGTATPAVGQSSGAATPIIDSGTAAVPASEQCGEDQNVHGEGVDEAVRGCLWDAYQAGKPATFRTVAYTIEGDPIAFDVQVLGADEIRVLVDSEDKFGEQGQFRYSCTRMERTDRSGFALTGCTGHAEAVHIP